MGYKKFTTSDIIDASKVTTIKASKPESIIMPTITEMGNFVGAIYLKDDKLYIIDSRNRKWYPVSSIGDIKKIRTKELLKDED